MEISSQCVIYAVCYGLIAVAVWRAGRPFPLLMGFCVLEITYSFARARFLPGVDLAMLGLGLLVCVEALYHALRRDYPHVRTWAIIAAGSLAAVSVIPAAEQMRFGVLSTRHIAIMSFAAAFTVLVLLDWQRPLACSPAVRLNLRLLWIWLVARTASTLAYSYWPDTSMEAWVVLGWMFICALSGIAVAYALILPRRQFS